MKELTESRVEAGVKLIQEADKGKLVNLTVVFWAYIPENEDWRLLVSTPSLESKGPKSVYKSLQSIIKRSGIIDELPLGDIALVNKKSSLIVMMKMAVKTGRNIANISFKGNTVNGTLLPDALIYRVT